MKNYLFVLLTVLILAALEQTIQFLYKVRQETAEISCGCDTKKPVTQLGMKALP